MESAGKRKRLSYTYLRDDELSAEADQDEPYEEPHRKTRQREQKMRWTTSEDALLQEGVSKQQRESKTPAGSIDWSVVASKLRKRDAKQCRERWVEYLNPSISRSAFTEEEDSALLELQSKHGNHWKVVYDDNGVCELVCDVVQMIHELLAERFPQRSSTAVKARWYLLQNREKRRMRLAEENNNIDTPTACIPADDNDSAAAISVPAAVAASSSAVASAALTLVNMAASSSTTTDDSPATISNPTHDDNNVSLNFATAAPRQYQLPNYEYSQWQERRVQQAVHNRNTSMLAPHSDFTPYPLTTHPSSYQYHSSAYPHYVPYSYFSALPQMHAHHVQQLQTYYTHPLSQQSQQFQQQQYSQHLSHHEEQQQPQQAAYQWKPFQDKYM